MNRKLGLALLGILVVATLVFLVWGFRSDKKGDDNGAAVAGKDGSPQGSEASGGKAPVAGGEEGLRGDDPTAKSDPNLQLPGALPNLNVPAGVLPQAPTTPHGQLELEGDVQEGDAEKAVRAIFPAIRDCYVELRKRAPQARGRMLMTFSVKPAADAGQASTGELFLKETQFTDPAYLTCVRTAIDSTKFQVQGNVNGKITVPLFLSPQDAGEKP
ncbi:MAG: hypothetical protein ACOYOB_10680 [Myxococcota bacterium]